ncbi:uncharacterized protein [Neodiprion pinetum]|uniref:uncharacterized protein isoform X1 n=1 Tax=Neodiprion pinetum TaxID=441929 RepID=UPI001EDEDB22|nr:uncharacterized protein LOC124213556 isoform X1 [Neodiprion pinetum]
MRERVLFLLLLFFASPISNSSICEPKSEYYISRCDEGRNMAKDTFYRLARGNETKYKYVDQCLLNDECPDLSAMQLNNLHRSENDAEQFELRVFECYDYDLMILNLTVTNIHFNKVKILFQYIKDQKIYQAIDLSHVAPENSPKQLSWLYPINGNNCLYDATLQILVEVDSTNYLKQYKVKVPNSQPNEHCHAIKERQLLTYVDTSELDEVRLHIQSFPAECNVSQYEVKFCKYIDDSCSQPVAPDSSNKTGIWEWYRIPQENTQYYFTVVPLSSKCEHECKAVASAVFMRRRSPAKVIVMIVGAGCIPIVMFFALRQIYVYWTKHHQLPVLRARKPYCLLTYDAVHDTHIGVMTKLAEYLRSCDINAMIDVLDAPKDPLKNPSIWCTSAFKMASTVIVAESPPRDISVTVTRSIYRYLHAHVWRLIEEDYHRKKKRYFVIEFPYSKPDSVHLHAYSFKRFKMPKDLDNLVDEIHNATYSKLCPRDKGDFLKSLKLAKDSMPDPTLDKKPISSENISRCSLKNNDQNDTYSKTHNISECTVFIGCKNDDKKRFYATDIGELELLGVNDESE